MSLEFPIPWDFPSSSPAPCSRDEPSIPPVLLEAAGPSRGEEPQQGVMAALQPFLPRLPNLGFLPGNVVVISRCG